MPYLTKEQILGIQDLAKEEVEVPEWHGSVFVRTMTGTEHDSLEEQLANAGHNYVRRYRILVCALTICDEHGGRLFDVKEVEALGEKSKPVLGRLYEVACRLSLLRDMDREEAKKNASDAPEDASGSSSPDSSDVL